MTMTTGKFISQLEASIKKLESLIQNLQCSNFHPSTKQYETFADLNLRLHTAANNLPVQVAALKSRRAEPSFEEGRRLICQAQSVIKILIANTKLEDRIIFARNIIYFFDGQRDSVVDSEATKTRKQLTRERCERICTLNPDGLISWAVAFMPTIWTANLMSKDTFDYIFEHIEPDDYQVWPPDMYHILSGLGSEEPLRESRKYHEFLKAIEDDRRKAQSPRKRRRVSDRAAPEGGVLSSVQYASRGVTSLSEATETNNQIAAHDKSGSSQGAERLLTNNRQLIAKAPTNETTNTEPASEGKVFALTIDDARYAMSSDEGVRSIFLTNPGLETESSFLTAWVSKEMGTYLGERGRKLGYKYRPTKTLLNQYGPSCSSSVFGEEP